MCLFLASLLRAALFARSLSVALLRPRGVKSMNTPIRWNASASQMVHAVARPKWEEVRHGLRLAALGCVCLLALGVAGVFLVWLAHQVGPSDPLLGLGTAGVNTLGWILAATGVFLGY